MFRYECDAWMMRCSVFRKKSGTIPHECRASTGLCLWQINLTTPALLGPPSSPVPHVSWGTAVFNWTQQTSCFVVVETLQGQGKGPAGITSLRQSDSFVQSWLYSLYLWEGKMGVMFPLEVSGNFTRVPQLLTYSGWWLSCFTHQLLQDPQLSPLEIPVNVAALAPHQGHRAALCIPGSWQRASEWWLLCETRCDQEGTSCLVCCQLPLSGPLWPFCTNVLDLELCLGTMQSLYWSRIVTYRRIE